MCPTWWVYIHDFESPVVHLFVLFFLIVYLLLFSFGLELTTIILPLPQSTGFSGVSYHAWPLAVGGSANSPLGQVSPKHCPLGLTFIHEHMVQGLCRRGAVP